MTGLGLKLALAESCTGGLLCAALTAHPGASICLRGGVVAYDNLVKHELLDVPENVLEQFGAVSRQTVSAMARGARLRLRADIGLAITGIAGPGGGTPGKPVGLVYIGCSIAAGETARRLELAGNRANVRLTACLRACQLALAALGPGSCQPEPAG